MNPEIQATLFSLLLLSNFVVAYSLYKIEKKAKLLRNEVNEFHDYMNTTYDPDQEPHVLRYECSHEYLPNRGSYAASGIDVYSPVKVVIPPGQDAKINLGVKFDIPYGWDLTVHNKSGVATKLKLIKGAELVDSDYTGNVHAHLFNLGTEDVVIQEGEKLTQLVMRKVWLGGLSRVSDIAKTTERGEGGFGSTGTKHEQSSIQLN